MNLFLNINMSHKYFKNIKYIPYIVWDILTIKILFMVYLKQLLIWNSNYCFGKSGNLTHNLQVSLTNYNKELSFYHNNFPCF